MDGTFENYQQVYRMLQDDESKVIYLNKLNYMISGEQKYLDAIVAEYFPHIPVFSGKTIEDLKAALPKDRKIVFYGAGAIGRLMLSYLEKDNRFVGFCSQTKSKQENGYCGYPVMSPEELLSEKNLSVIITSIDFDEEIRDILEMGGYPKDQIYRSIEYLPYTDAGQYFAPSFMEYEDEEVLVDAGCFDLHSSLEMRKYCRHLKKVYAFEPDPESYAICLERKKRFDSKEVKLFPAGLWSKRTILRFKVTRDGGAHIYENGDISIPVVPLDEEIEPTDKVTMIKMDIEGSELEALKGARGTIERDKPKLAICIYHKPEDMITIPLYIKSLVPEYRIYIRHHSNSGAETVLYAVR